MFRILHLIGTYQAKNQNDEGEIVTSHWIDDSYLLLKG